MRSRFPSSFSRWTQAMAAATPYAPVKQSPEGTVSRWDPIRICFRSGSVPGRTARRFPAASRLVIRPACWSSCSAAPSAWKNSGCTAGMGIGPIRVFAEMTDILQYIHDFPPWKSASLLPVFILLNHKREKWKRGVPHLKCSTPPCRFPSTGMKEGSGTITGFLP